MKVSNLLKAIFVLSLLSSLLMMILNPLRLLFILNSFVIFISFNFLLISFLALIAILIFHRLKFERIEVFMVILLFLLLIKAVFFDCSYKPVNILLDFVKPLFFIAVVCIYRNFTDFNDISNSKSINFTLNSLLIITISMIVVSMGISKFYIPMYPAYTMIESTFAFNAGSPVKNIIYSVWLFIGGKRGVFLAFVFVFALYMFVNISLPKKITLLLVLSFIGSVLFIFLGKYIATAFFKVDSFSAIQRMDMVELVTFLGGGRISEITSSLSYIDTLPRFLFGAGLGFEYIVKDFGMESGELHRNVHFSPVSMLTIYGSLFSCLFYIYIFKYVVFSMRVISDKNTSRIAYSIVFFFLSSVVFSFTEYVFFSYSNVPISMGIVGFLYKINRAKRMRLCVV
nr:hypothetical protein [Plesiomonas shigelloides]